MVSFFDVRNRLILIKVINFYIFNQIVIKIILIRKADDFAYLITTIKSPVVVETPVTKAEADNISH